MKAIKNFLFSMQFTGILLLVFAVAIGAATFIENDFGPVGSKAVVYNAKWFEFVLLLLAVNLTGSIFTRKLYKREKLPQFLFHFSFLVIFLGSAITRYISYEGHMSIREGSFSNYITSDNAYFEMTATQEDQSAFTSKKLLLSPIKKNWFSKSLRVGDNTVSANLKEYIPSAMEQITNKPESDEPAYLQIAIFDGMQRKDVYIKENDSRDFRGFSIGFNTGNFDNDLNILRKNDSLYAQTSKEISYMRMAENESGTIAKDSLVPFELSVLYASGKTQFVLSQVIEHGVVNMVSSGEIKSTSHPDALVIELKSGDETKTVNVIGKQGMVGQHTTAEINGVAVDLAYGSVNYDLPFSIRLIDFQLERYPGSNSPSSFASEVVLIDKEKNLEKPYRIFMNHVLNYRGYRFFQSSYDQDEMGTIFSVNHDAWGTMVTYIGYFLMALGMILTLFNRRSRFHKILSESTTVRKKRIGMLSTIIFVSIFGFGAHAQGNTAVFDKAISPDFAQKIETGMLIQDQGGRIKPLGSFSSEVLRKISRKTSFNGLTPTQVFIEMMTNPTEWQDVPMIKVSHKALKETIGVTGKYASFNQLVDFSAQNNVYKIGNLVQSAYAKEPSQRSKFDKDVMAVDERVNICYMIYTGSFLRIFPIPGHSNSNWAGMAELKGNFNGDDSVFVSSFLHDFLGAVVKGNETGDYTQADQLLAGLKTFQDKYGADVIPSPSKANMEIKYNQWNIFNKLTNYYGLIGFILLVLAFINILAPKMKIKWITIIASVFVILLFVMHTAGLGLRWYISGHAPWSDAFESLVFIAWATILAGIVFSFKSPITLTSTSLLASLILSVAHLNWLDPEITNLVPVLKSYWLIIHVAIITSSYGFLALGALLGFFSLVLMIMKTRKNNERLSLTIREFSYINETTLEIGLFLLTVGTFLGGVWANESWGRYWGWDPKETWALVTVLAYSFIVHMRMIPGLKGIFAFNFASLIGYGTVLMTYFGVNYYLSGLHSYASGDPVPVPSFVYYTLGVIVVVAILAFWRNKRIEEPK